MGKFTKEVNILTGNQISYARFLEDQRHNYATEAYQQRQIAEIERHNLIQESQGWKGLLETERHNRAGESLGWANLAETTRANKARESIQWAGHYETVRHNKAGEAYNMSYLSELRRHNMQSESVQWYNAEHNYMLGLAGQRLGYLNYTVAQQNADTQYQRMFEERRSHLTSESMYYAKHPTHLWTNPEWATYLATSYTSAADTVGNWFDVAFDNLDPKWFGSDIDDYLKLLPGYDYKVTA